MGFIEDDGLESYVSAAHAVFSIPTLLSDIFSYVNGNDWGLLNQCDWHQKTKGPYDWSCCCCTPYQDTAALLPCALVNKDWFRESVRFIWRTTPIGTCLSDIMGKVEPDRRQVYANCIESTFLKGNCTTHDPEGKPQLPIQDHFLESLSYPRLKRVEMKLEGADLPRIQGVNVLSLVLDPRYDLFEEKYWMYPYDMEAVLDVVVASFPNTKSIHICDRCFVHPGSLERFEKKMLKLKEFNHRSAHELAKGIVDINDEW